MEPTAPKPAVEGQPIIPLTASVPATAADSVGQVSLKPGKEKLPRNLRRLFGWVLFIALVPNLTSAFITFMSAVQAQMIDPEGKVQALALISGAGAVVGLVAGPIIGLLSDRTRSRWGARRPWILVGGLVIAAGCVAAGFVSTIPALLVAVVAVQLGVIFIGVPLSAILPDRVPIRFRGRYSAFAGFGALLGGVTGGLLGASIVNNLPLGYAIVGVSLLTIVALFVATVTDKDNRDDTKEAFSLLGFLKAFWVNPVRYPDFFWGFTGRLLIFGSQALPATFGLYILQDYIGVPTQEAILISPLISLAAVPTILISTLVAGPLSDRIGRRKPIVLISGLLIASAAVVPLVWPTIPGMVLSTALIGLGFGAFGSVDGALMSQLLPSKERYGTDLGVLAIAGTLPNIFAPAIAGAIVLATGGYFALYIVVAIVGLAGALAVIPIRGAK